MRKNIRLIGYDYSSNGSYFITICTKKRKNCLSEISVGEAALGLPLTELTDIGKIVNENIKKTGQVYRNADVIKYVIMPDHIHMILFISDFYEEMTGRPGAASPTKSVPLIINGLKTISTKQIGYTVWQRSYYDHIIRNEKEFLQIYDYIENNPVNWANNIYNQNIWR